MSLSINYGSIKLKDLLIKIKNGSLSVPSFQRDFDWTAKDIARLYQSLVHKGEPFGSIVIWNDSDNSKAIPNESKIFKQLTKATSTTEKSYLIDGQQRVTSFAISYLWSINPEAKGISKITSIFYDIKEMKFVHTLVPTSDQIPSFHFHAKDTKTFKENVKTYLIAKQRTVTSEEMENLIEAYGNFNNIDAGTITISSDDLNEVIDVFTLINTKGKRLSPFNIVHAYYIKKDKSFNLTDEYEKVIYERLKQKDTEWNIPLSTMLLLHYSILENTISNKEIMDKAQEDVTSDIKFIKEDLSKIYKQAVHELISMGYLTFDFLPSDKFLYLTAKTIHHLGGKNLNKKQFSILSKWFKYAVLNDRYASGGEGSKINGFKEDWDLLRNFIINEEFVPDKIKWARIREFDSKSIMELSYGSTSLDGKYVISKMVKNIPSIATGKQVVKSKNSMKNLNLHHLFPAGHPDFESEELINSVANLTPLEFDDNLDIGNASPDKYIGKYVTHNDFGIYLFPENGFKDFKEFIEQRSQLIAKKLTNDWE